MTVKKLNLVGEKKVVLEMLEDKQQRVRPQTAGACRIWAQKLANPENSIEVCLLKAVSVESKNNCREICEEKRKGLSDHIFDYLMPLSILMKKQL